VPKMENGKLILEKPVTFKTGSAELTDEGKEALIPVKEFLIQKRLNHHARYRKSFR
jgi:hypothetical protein